SSAGCQRKRSRLSAYATGCYGLSIRRWAREVTDQKSEWHGYPGAGFAEPRACLTVLGNSPARLRSRLSNPCGINAAVTEPRPSGSGFVRNPENVLSAPNEPANRQRTG